MSREFETSWSNTCSDLSQADVTAIAETASFECNLLCSNHANESIRKMLANASDIIESEFPCANQLLMQKEAQDITLVSGPRLVAAPNDLTDSPPHNESHDQNAKSSAVKLDEPSGQLVRKTLEELDSDSFGVRQNATTDLKNMGVKALPILFHAMDTNPSTEVRKRAELILQTLLPAIDTQLHKSLDPWKAGVAIDSLIEYATNSRELTGQLIEPEANISLLKEPGVTSSQFGLNFLKRYQNQTVDIVARQKQDIARRITRVQGLGAIDADLNHLHDFPKISTLTLPDADITEKGLQTIGQLKTLQELYLDVLTFPIGELGNPLKRGFSDRELTHLSQLTNLRTLSISGTAIDGSCLAKLTNLNALERIVLSGTAVTDDNLAHLQDYPAIKGIDLAETKVTNKGLEHLARVKGLQSINLNFCGITDAGLSSIEQLTNLTRLSLKETAISDQGLEALSKVANIKDLNLSGCQITSMDLHHLTKLQHLEVLNLTDTLVDGYALTHIQGMKGLKTLHLGYCSIEKQDLESLKKCKNLKVLDLEGSPISLNAETMLELSKALPDCEIRFTSSRP